MTPHSVETYSEFFLLFFSVGVCGNHRRPLGGILSVYEPREWLCGLENVTRVYINTGGEQQMGEIQYGFTGKIKVK